MFNEIKLTNSTVPTTEPVKIAVSEGTKIIYGCALVKDENERLVPCPGGACPEYVSVSSEADSYGMALVCPVVGNAVYCVTYCGENPTVGQRVSVLCKEEVAVSVAPDTEGAGIITDLDERVGYVYVKFKV